jgi:hypothetical protein
MSVNEEIAENAEHAHDDFSRMAAATMAIIAAILAIVAVNAHLMTTEELLMQQKSADQWAYSQAKNLRHYQSEVAVDLLKAMPGEQAAKAVEKYEANLARFAKETEEIQEKAREYGSESLLSGRRALRLHLGEIFLELAIVFTSLAILSRRRMFWTVGVGGALIGLVISSTVFLIKH